MPPMAAGMPTISALEGLRPSGTAYLPGADLDPASVPAAVPRRLVQLADGDTLRLEAGFVRRTLRGEPFVMYGFNGQYPGPLIRVPDDATIVVDFRNAIDRPTTVHWHGVRLDNAFDGVPGVTQEAVEPGESFRYEIHFPDAGLYWYHPHVREDVQQELGLYGNLLVDPAEPAYYPPANREVVLMLDDLLVDDDGLLPFGDEAANHALMGRFGNLLLVNGEPGWELEVQRGEVVRFFLTNVSNTRTFNLSFGELRPKLLATDLGRFERETRVESVLIGPAQRYVVDVRFEQPGAVPLVNAIQALDHLMARFRPQTDTLGAVRVAADPVVDDHADAFGRLREHPEIRSRLDEYLSRAAARPELELVFSIDVEGLPSAVRSLMGADTIYAPPLELNDAMPMMNWAATTDEVRWILREPSTGRENMDIEWSFETGQVVKLRLVNDPGSSHPMNHPIHLHGQRFLVLERDGRPTTNLAWKDTVIVPVGSTVDLLVEMSNPGDWMLHCHISEHLAAGMRMVFRVEGDARIR